MSWDQFQKFYLPFESIGFAADFSRVTFTDEFFQGPAAVRLYRFTLASAVRFQACETNPNPAV